MSISIISAVQAQQKLQQGALLIDIREADEHRRECIQGALSQPLSQLQSGSLSPDANWASCVIFHCKSGIRTQNATELLIKLTQSGSQEVYILENGLNGWKNAGLPTQLDRSQPIEIMRQVQIVAGSLVLIGVILGYFVTPAFYALSAFVGAGLLFAGISGFCGMAKLLAIMPWNRLHK